MFRLLDESGALVEQQRITTSKTLDNVVFVTFNQLNANSKYMLQSQCCAESDLDDLGWAHAFTLDVKTFPVGGEDTQTNFVLTSCRHPGIAGFKQDEMLEKLHTHLNQDNNFHFRIACGDQIYADHVKGTFIPKSAPKSLKGYFQKYRRSYNKAFQNVARKIPTYCVFDDHEIVNDWSLGKFKSAKPYYRKHHVLKKRVAKPSKFDKGFLNRGLFAYDLYQGLLSGQVESLGALNSRAKADYLSVKFDYTQEFMHGKCGFFFLDIRYERIEGSEFHERNNPNFEQMISDLQQHHLINFLNKPEYTVKFVVSAVPMFPDTKEPLGAPFDKWKGGNRQRAEILKHIDENDIKNVFVLSGDVHCSFTARVTLSGGTQVHNIVSSALNWPIIGLREKDLDTDDLFESDVSNICLLSEPSQKKVITTNNYTAVSYSDNKVTVSVYDRTGLVKQHNIQVQ